jgi:23S rRNA (uracil1939-C5)-methyltransferase
MFDEQKEIISKQNNLKENLSYFITKKNLYQMVPSPKNFKYRNNIMFSIGYDKDGKIEVGPFESPNSKIIISAEENLLVSDLGIIICSYIKEWVSEHSVLQVTKYPEFNGFWRHIQIKQNDKNEFILGFRIGDFYFYESTWRNEKYRLINFILTRKELISNRYKLLNISYQLCFGKKEPLSSEPFYEIYNEGDLIQSVLDKQFIINMGCFFQVNSTTTKLIYGIVKNIIKKNDVLFDFCCGIGMYSIILSKYFKNIYAIDSNESNIILGQKNQELNKINNIDFIVGNIQDEVKDLIWKHNNKNKTLVINPPRRGLYNIVLESINNYMSQFKQIIYISCNAETLKRDLDKLYLGKKKIRNIIPINQFPNTSHYEIIVNIY